MGDQVGVLAQVWRYPVKSTLGERVETAALTAKGVAGDRVWALLDTESGHVVSAKRPKRWGALLGLASMSEGSDVRVVLPDGSALLAGSRELDERLSALLGRDVTLVSEAPPGAVFEEAWEAELKNGVPPWFDLPTRPDAEDGELVEGGQFMSEQGTLFNFGAVHLVTTGTLRRLRELAPGSDFAAERFRPNLVVDTDEDGFVETAWQGRTLTVGDVRLTVSFTVPRCVVTTLGQADLPQDRDVLRTVATHNAVDCFGSGTRYPCVGVYADVVAVGAVATGQMVALEPVG